MLTSGKPGLLCVEGCGKEVDRYMSRIKSESWSDIPPFQKKVYLANQPLQPTPTNFLGNGTTQKTTRAGTKTVQDHGRYHGSDTKVRAI